MTRNRTILPLLIVIVAQLLGCGDHRGPAKIAESDAAAATAATQDGATDRSAARHQDAPLDERAVALVTLALDVAAALPDMPHAKTKARLQDDVADLLVELDRPSDLRRLADDMVGWRRGMVEAKLALLLAEKGAGDEARAAIAEAEQVVSDLGHDDTEQEWRADRVRLGVAYAKSVLGEVDEALEIQSDLGASEWGKLDAFRARQNALGDYQVSFAQLKQGFKTAGLEQARSLLQTLVHLHEHHYEDAPRRAELQEMIKTSFATLPLDLRIDYLAQITEHALAHHDQAGALELVVEMEKIASSCAFQPRAAIPLGARVAALRFRAGDTRGGRKALDQSYRAFEDVCPRLTDVFRARTLRPVAEAYHAIGDDEAAVAAYERALAECVVNPNSRPRAEDLVALCISVVRSGLAGDERLGRRIAEVRDGLGEPW